MTLVSRSLRRPGRTVAVLGVLTLAAMTLPVMHAAHAEPVGGNGPVYCYWGEDKYSVGGVVTLPDGSRYVCTFDGLWMAAIRAVGGTSRFPALLPAVHMPLPADE
jgi:hypothetical protein